MQVKRADVYGSTAKVVTDNDGTELATGVLTQEGVLLSKANFVGLSVDEKGSFEGKASYICDGETVAPIPASFKESREIEKIGDDALDEFAVESVYPINVETDLEPGLYSTTFSYVQSVDPKDCLIMISKDGPGFLLAGSKLAFSPAGKSVVYSLFDNEADDADEEEGDFDFGDMFRLFDL